MKFRGKIICLLSIRNFSQLIQALSKISKHLVIKMSPDKLVFVLSEKEVKANGLCAWCEFSTATFFSEYLMEGLSPRDNQIYMEISSEYLASVLSALKNSQNTTGLKLKLTRKGVPCLTIEIETQNANSSSLCVHDIPITLLPLTVWADYQQPQLPAFNISLSLPDVKVVRQTLERLKNLSKKLRITAKPEAQGKIIASVKSISVKSSVTYSGLRMYQIEGADPGNVDLEAENGPRVFKVEVDMKNLFQVLPTDSLKPTNSICSITEGRLLHLFYIFSDATLQYCIPAISVYD